MATCIEIHFTVHPTTKNIEVAEHAIRYEMKDGERAVLERAIHRHVLTPGSDLTGQHPDVRAAAEAAWADLPEE